MARRVNRRKRRIRICILAAGCLAVLVLIFVILSFLFHALFPQKEAKKTEEKKEKIVLNSAKQYRKYHVDESGNVPVMMYHGIHGEILSKDTGNTGGNVDVDGYQRTADAFEKDLEMYYKKGYRMIRLNDYLDGKIDVEAGKSPIVLTFDDGLENNIRVTGVDKNGELKIDPKSAVGILEKFKKKYPDFHVTATFFITGGKFSQPKYDDKIIKWLIDHDYDVGNHTWNHPDFTELTTEQANEQVALVYDMLEEIIPGKYVNIVALPFGSPYKKDHETMPYVYDCTSEDKEYHTKCALQVAWEPDYSPYTVEFDPTFIKRIRAYDNNGTNFDIESTFQVLESTRYISDGDEKTIVVPKENKDRVDKTYKKRLKTYE